MKRVRKVLTVRCPDCGHLRQTTSTTATRCARCAAIRRHTLNK